MIIGIDIDDTIVNTNDSLFKYAQIYNEEIGNDFEIKKDEWEWNLACGWYKQEQIQGFYDKYLRKALEGVTLKPNAKEIINKLKSEGHKIIFITARSEADMIDHYEFTKNWLDKNGIKYNKLISGSFEKYKECRENNVDIFIDDGINNCIAVSQKANIPVYMFDSIYNSKVETPSKISRVDSWDTIYKIINNK